ncbi:hypothetical protein SAMN05216176_117104 [Nitratireductor indicus]|nr:hypothetical protein SAMN05216176_117104 [Nitratireductor indicus]
MAAVAKVAAAVMVAAAAKVAAEATAVVAATVARIDPETGSIVQMQGGAPFGARLIGCTG